MKFFYSNLKITDIIHNDLECYAETGYGGKDIKKWPFYTFIKEWINGNREQARSLWVDWLVNEFFKYCLVAKSKGGMYQGSVHHYAINFVTKNKNELWLNPSSICKIFVRKGAEVLVNRRIEMIRSIVNNGYQINLKDPIYAVKEKNLYILKGGHHRATVMYILGHERLPGVIVYTRPMWELKKWLTKIKKYLR